MEKAFPDYSVRRGFTAQIVIDHIQRRDGEVIDNMTQALDRVVDNGVKTLIVQPTHLMDGFEYNDVADVEVLREYRRGVDSRWMFPSPVKEDAPLSHGVARRRLQHILERAGCRHIRFHDMRYPNVKPKTKDF